MPTRRSAPDHSAVRRVGAALKGLAPLGVLIVFWQLFIDDPLVFPKPSKWIESLFALNADEVLLPALASTAVTYVLGVGCSVVLGIALGLILGASRPIQGALSPVLEFLRALPIPVVIPVLVLLFGSELSTSVLIIVLGVIWPVLLNTITAVRNIPGVRRDAARIMGLRLSEITTKVLLPSVTPAIIVGVRISASLAVVIVLVSEMIQGTTGIGFLLMVKQSTFDASAVWGLLLLIGFIGFVINAILLAAEDRALRKWPPRE